MYSNRLRFQKTDCIAIGFVLLLALLIFLGFLPGQQDIPACVEIYRDGQLTDTYPLNENREIVIEEEYANTITIRDEMVAVTHSDCPGTDCVNSGWIGSTGRSIVCLPNALEIRVVGVDSEVDFVVR